MRVSKTDLDEYDRLRSAQHQHRHDFDCAVADRISELPSVGYVEADYVDLAGTQHRSTASLLVQERDENSPLTPNWPPLTLGRLSVVSPLPTTIASISVTATARLDWRVHFKHSIPLTQLASSREPCNAKSPAADCVVFNL
jgi:hypothetical protein